MARHKKGVKKVEIFSSVTHSTPLPVERFQISSIGGSSESKARLEAFIKTTVKGIGGEL
jgi:hypothetical protein